MKKTYLFLGVLLFIVWPHHTTNADVENKPTIESLINYQKVKYEVLKYQIDKKIQKIENKIDSQKLKK